MKAHDFARQLLRGPNLDIISPRVKEYELEEEKEGCAPAVCEMDGLTCDDEPCRVLVITPAIE